MTDFKIGDSVLVNINDYWNIEDPQPDWVEGKIKHTNGKSLAIELNIEKSDLAGATGYDEAGDFKWFVPKHKGGWFYNTPNGVKKISKPTNFTIEVETKKVYNLDIKGSFTKDELQEISQKINNLLKND